jgi:hypothetical protein
MIRVGEVAEPKNFDKEARQAGNDWLNRNPGKEPKDYWSPFRRDLARGFNDLCGYSAMWTGNPTVDHFIPKSSKEGRTLVYEWSNYRYADDDMNRAKSILPAGILDPFIVGDDWFEILLPNLEMIMTDHVPEGYRGDARSTLRELGLGYGADILEKRRSWYKQFNEGIATLSHLARHAPLIARAVRKRLDEINVAALEDAQTWFDEFMTGIHTLKTLRSRVPHLATIIEDTLSRPDTRTLRRS